ncbi:MAG: extracellular solute-binding protein [Longimicrobiales bacterium]
MAFSRFVQSPRRVVTALFLIAAGCTGGDDGRTPVVVYSPHGRELLETFETEFETRHPLIDVQWLDMGSQEVLDRLRSEKANPQADVWWGGPAPMFVTAVEQELLQPFLPTWSAQLPADARGANGQWHGTYLTPMVIAYNTTSVAADSVPRDWDEVLEPQWHDRVLIRDPVASGTMRTIFGMIIERSLRATGDTAAGFDWLRRLDAQNKEYVLNPTLLYQKLARGEGDITLWDMPDIEELKARTTFPIDYVLPASGTPVPVDAIALVAGAQHADSARVFIEYVGSVEGVVYAARNFFRLPARSDIPADSFPEGLARAREQMVVEPMDWSLFQERSADWMRYWDEHVRGRN